MSVKKSLHLFFFWWRLYMFSSNWINFYHFGCDTNHIYLEITRTWNSISRLQDGGVFRKIDLPWTTTSWAGLWGITMRRELCRRWQVSQQESFIYQSYNKYKYSVEVKIFLKYILYSKIFSCFMKNCKVRDMSTSLSAALTLCSKWHLEVEVEVVEEVEVEE